MQGRLDRFRESVNILQCGIGGRIESNILFLLETNHLKRTLSERMLDIRCQPNPCEKFHLHILNVTKRGI